MLEAADRTALFGRVHVKRPGDEQAGGERACAKKLVDQSDGSPQSTNLKSAARFVAAAGLFSFRFRAGGVD